MTNDEKEPGDAARDGVNARPRGDAPVAVPVEAGIERVAAPLRQQVIDRLRRAIVNAEYKPGERLLERELTDRLKVSRTVIREALRQLEAEGLVTIIPNRGPVVAVLSRDEAAALYEVREVLEPTLGKLFAQRASDEQVEELHGALENLRGALEDGNYLSWVDAKGGFYAVLFAGARNEIMQSLVKTIYARTQYLRGLSADPIGRRRQGFEEIVRVVEAIDRRDADGAAAALQFHVQHLATTVLDTFDRLANDPDVSIELLRR